MHALKRYGQRLSEYLNAIHGTISEDERETLRKGLKIDRLLQDIGPLIEGSLEGAERVGEIVEDLRRFSTPNQQQCQHFDLIRVVNTAAEWVTKARREQPALQLEMPTELSLLGYDQVMVLVRDNGPGILPDQLLRVFDPFYTTKSVGKGTGLGLYISYNLATEQCGGTLEACNLNGGGAEFKLTLPRVTAT